MIYETNPTYICWSLGVFQLLVNGTRKLKYKMFVFIHLNQMCVCITLNYSIYTQVFTYKTKKHLNLLLCIIQMNGLRGYSLVFCFYKVLSYLPLGFLCYKDYVINYLLLIILYFNKILFLFFKHFSSRFLVNRML